MKIDIKNHVWKLVYNIPKGTKVKKGRHGIYWDLRNAASDINDQFGCYSWKTCNSVMYCGSFFKDNNNKEFNSNLEGRIHNYLQNHSPSTNKRIFDSINSELSKNNVSLCILNFTELKLDNNIYSFRNYTEDTELVQTVEQLLICYYRKLAQCSWNIK